MMITHVVIVERHQSHGTYEFHNMSNERSDAHQTT
jgi:hypothetical protein